MAPRKKVDAAQLQSPSKVGEVDLEIAERSPDVHEKESSEHRKVFVIPGTKLEGDQEAFHAANIDGMRQEAINLGLRPTEDGQFVGSTPHADGQSQELTYSVAVVPAVVATQEQNQVHVTVEDQHAPEETPKEN